MSGDTAEGLRRDVIGLREVLFGFLVMRHLLLPALGIVAFVPAPPTAAGLPGFDFVSEPTVPVSYAGPIVAVWMAAGVVVLVVLIRRRPGRTPENACVHLDEPPSPSPCFRQNGAVRR
ncbi:hypothetical protein [Streptomyces sp. NL15-2K]|uniref:hypothetical protein n=1 Tax=Streptomyces sp. NL15-2K TaxID=376149 RepID=UPI000FFA23A5|nr:MULTISPECIES: hypothetical protein [Actinomycetes]WKX14837.1 hypothetical protein Q4V64_48035 [Kutzneria buriramensis]GCB51763.1 hypothetical protein SNL152K_9119 [Streptomyces sp. NL15-2K]